jgi:hypothetical protein
MTIVDWKVKHVQLKHTLYSYILTDREVLILKQNSIYLQFRKLNVIQLEIPTETH